MELSPCISQVRLTLADLPYDFLDDLQILGDLRRADVYATAITYDGVNPDTYHEAVVALASYYSFNNWTVLVSKQLGEIPFDIHRKSEELRSMAKSFLSLITSMKLNDDLTVDQDSFKYAPSGIMLTNSSLGYSNE